MVATSNSGPFGGAKAPLPPSGMTAMFLPHWAYVNTVAGLTSTTTRLYYIPYYFPVAGLSYTGLKCHNSGAGDNADTLRLGVYQASATTGLPSTLVIDAGEITLSGAAAVRTLASAWTAPYEGWGFLALHCNQAAEFYAFTNVSASSTAVGVIFPAPSIQLFGAPSTTFAISNTATNFGAYYVDTAYGALAASAVAPTAILTTCPAVAPYRT